MILPLALSVLQNLVVGLFVLVCFAIILIVLLQKGRGGGISGAFGGGGGAGSLLGTKTGDFLTWVTICLVASFLVLAILMGKFIRPKTSADLAAPPATGTSSIPASQPTTGAPTGAPTGEVSMPEAAIPGQEQTPPAADEATDTAEDLTETAEEPMEPTN